MRVKALTTFGGQYAMYKGDIAEIPDGPVADILIRSRYIIPIAGDESAEDIEEPVAEEVPEEQAAEDAEPTSKLIDLDKLTKDQLVEFAEEQGIEIDSKEKKADILTLIKSELEMTEGE